MEKKSHQIEAYTHESSKRPNNPKAGLAHYDNTGGELTHYSFDPHISPALDWAGKSEGISFDVPCSSVHVHEVITPHRVISQTRRDDPQGWLFPEISPWQRLLDRTRAIEAYRHLDNWTNRLIAGDSLVIMNSLLQKEGMAGKVQMFYIDPPYGIRYGSNFQPFVNKRDVKDRSDDDLTTEPEMIKAFRDTWELGIHSYLTYLRDRLLLVRELLSEEGSVFIQISDENVHLVRNLCDEVFGPENFVSMITFIKSSPLGSKGLPGICDFLIWYAKDKPSMKYHQLYLDKDLTTDKAGVYRYVELPDGTRRPMTKEELAKPETLPKGARIFRKDNITSQGTGGTSTFPIEFEGKTYTPGRRHWKTNEEGMKRLIEARRIFPAENSLCYIRYLDDFPAYTISNVWPDTGTGSFTDEKRYVVQTGTKTIARCILMTTDPGDLVMDITCGSGTTAYTAEQWGRRWITCDTSRVALAIARQRLLTATYDYYKLAKPEAGISGGFVYRKVPHVTLKSIANDEAPDLETLYDSPEIDRSRIRITGPFTVEALPAPEVLSPDELASMDEEDFNEGARQSDWREQLLATGILGRHGERIRFRRVEEFHGSGYLHAECETDEERPRRAVVSFAGETVLMDGRRVYRGLEEAVRCLPMPELVVFAAFQFDAEASRMIRELVIPEGMTALQVQMNPDLMTLDLRKNVRSDQSFYLVGQPDAEIECVRAGRYRVRVLGFDYFNINTNKVESGNTDKIAMWLLDPDYDGMTLRPSQVFFPMEGRAGGWNKLAKTLRTEIDEELIAKFRGNVSLEFEGSEGQRAAVKIIDDRGIESMKVLTIKEDGAND